jgi:hypothetical protein
MTKVLTSRHAEDVGGVIVEPGQPIPRSADPDVVQRLEDAGLVREGKAGAKRSSPKDEED